MFSVISLPPSLCDHPLHQPLQSTCEHDLAGLTVLVRFEPTQLGKQLHFFPLPGYSQLIQEPCRYPCQRHQCAYPLQIEHLHLFPIHALLGELEAIFHRPSLPVHLENAHCRTSIFYGPLSQQQPRLPTAVQYPHLHQPHLLGHAPARTYAPDVGAIRKLQWTGTEH